MYTLFSICDLGLWQVILSWLLPFLLGILLGWFLWAKYKKQFKLAANDCDDLEDEINKLKDKLAACESKTTKKKTESKLSIKQEDTKQELLAFGIPTSKFMALSNDNLQIIEGVGPKMSEYLHSNGINSWETLATYDEHYLKNLLGKEGNKYRIIDPNSWPAQANLASKGEWEKLIDLQKSLVAGKKKVGSATDSKIEKIMTKLGILKKWKKDDLKAIEGIGPKIEKLLLGSGIDTWEKLSQSEINDLVNILSDAGKKFQLADPGSWPKQAKLAALGHWNELETLQDSLKGGRIT